MKTERVGGSFRTATLIALVILSFMLMMGFTAEDASAASINVRIDGTVIDFDADPIVENDTILVPIATINNHLGGTSTWTQSTQTATITNGSITVELKLGSETAKVNGVERQLLVAPKAVVVDDYGGGRIMVPLRFVAESFHYDVKWDQSSYMADILTQGAGIQTPQTATISATQIQTGQTYNGVAGYTLVSIIANQSLQAGNYNGTKLTGSYTYNIEGVDYTGSYRYYIDFPSYARGSQTADKIVSSDTSNVAAVRSGITNGAVRIVCDLKSNLTPEISYSADGTTMILAFAEASSDSPATPSVPAAGYNPYADGKLVVCIDPGHGATTGGKRSPDSTLMEWEFNRDVAYRLKALLEARGVTCVMTVAQDDQTDPSLASRVQVANSAGNIDLFVSIHANAFGNGWTTANGWEIYVYKKGGVAEVAANSIEEAMKNANLLKDRGVKTANFYVIKNTDMPAVLIEHGFYTNQAECERLKDSGFRDQLAQADLTGIMNFFSLYQ